MSEPRFFALAAGGLEAVLCDRGAALARLRAPDREGRLGDVVLGFDEPAAWAGEHPHVGVVVGRVANRIAGARFVLDGREVRLPANDGPHHLHGGPGGFGRRPFRAEPFEDPLGPGVRFTRTSPDGEEGHPGRVEMTVEIRLTRDAELRIDFRATCDAPTLVAPSHHAYFNLRDGGQGSVLDHELALRAGYFTPADADGIPDGRIEPVKGTPLDFRRPRRLGERLEALAESDGRGGYDHNLVLDGPPGQLRPAARLRDPASGRVLELETTLPGLQLYTGNGLDGRLAGRGGVRWGQHSGVCLEAQHFPDAIHHPAFPSPVLRPGEVFAHTTLHRFGAE